MAAEMHVALNIPCVANEDQLGRAALPSLIASHIINSPGCSSTRSSEDGEKVSVAALQKAALQRSLSLGTNAMIARLKQHGVGEVDADQVVALLDELDAQVKQLRDDHVVTRRERRVLMLYGALVALVSLLTVGVVLGVGAWIVLRYSAQVQNSILGTSNSNSQGGSTDMSWMRPASTPAHARKEYEWQYVADRMDLSQVEAIVIWPYLDSEMLLGVNGVMRLPEINLSGVPNPLSTKPSPLDKAAENHNTLATTSDLTDPTSQPASLVFNTALGVLRVNKNTLSVMNVDILDALEAAGVPTCRNPKGDRSVATGPPPCEIMIPPRARVGHQMHAQQQAMQLMSAGVRSPLPGTKVTLVLKRCDMHPGLSEE